MQESTASLEARALWFTGPREARLITEMVPRPAPGEVRVRALASAVSAGTEMLVYRGEVPEDLPLDLPTLSGGYGFPIKHGYASVGRVLDAGPGVESPTAGDLVFVHHPHQDVFNVPAEMPVRLPEGLDPVSGVFAANLETALNVVHDTPIKLGETALILGQGVVGLLVTQLLDVAGAARVLAVDPLEIRRDLSLAVGADAAFEGGDGLEKQVRGTTGRRGVDVVVEASGSGKALQSAIECVADEGTVVVASWYGTKPVTLDLGGRFHRGRIRLRSSQVGRIDPELTPRWDRDRRMEAVVELLPRLHLRELVTHRVPFGEAPEAYRMLDERPGEAVQVVFTHGQRGESDV